jgi:peroxiredoxin Q/BCP
MKKTIIVTILVSFWYFGHAQNAEQTSNTDENMSLLKEGTKAPDFRAVNQEGKNISLSDYKGKKVILYFYPKDDTPGCTAEACNLRDNYSSLTEKGFIVIGVSPDAEKSHQKFVEKYNLPFNLVADTTKEITKKYGAWGTKKMYGKEMEGVLRTTYVIDENGIIIKVIPKVETSKHAEQVLSELNM